MPYLPRVFVRERVGQFTLKLNQALTARFVITSEARDLLLLDGSAVPTCAYQVGFAS